MTHNSLDSEPFFIVVDDHEMIVEGTVNTLKQAYPDVEIVSCRTMEEAEQRLQDSLPDLIVADLSIPETLDAPSRLDTGVTLLKRLLSRYPEANFVVQSSHVNALIRIKPSIDAHRGGFTVADKALSKQDMLQKVEWSLQGIIYTPSEIRKVLEVKPEWVKVLKLAFEEGMQDRAIAQTMHVGERTVRNYWTKIQNALGVYPEEGINTRIKTGVCAREKGLID